MAMEAETLGPCEVDSYNGDLCLLQPHLKGYRPIKEGLKGPISLVRQGRYRYYIKKKCFLKNKKLVFLSYRSRNESD